MAHREVTLNLIDFRRFEEYYKKDQHFRVEKIKNSIDWKAGEWLTEVTIQDLITNSYTKVNVREAKDNDF